MPAFDPMEWIGREQRACDVLDKPLARRWLATFDLDVAAEDPLPQGIHWCLCVPETPTALLGRDGHPSRAKAIGGATDSFLPPIAAPRRMWAGSECEFLSPIELGVAVARVSRIEAIEEKAGTSGALSFVTVHHETSTKGTLALCERQTLVYREPPAPGSPPAPPLLSTGSFDETGWDAIERFTPSPALLFRYSALTFNTHRIHYDADYAREAENYRGLVVHAPLMATLLLQLAARQFGANVLKRFTFRGVSPAIAGEELVLALRGAGEAIELGVFSGDGRQVMKASASI